MWSYLEVADRLVSLEVADLQRISEVADQLVSLEVSDLQRISEVAEIQKFQGAAGMRKLLGAEAMYSLTNQALYIIQW